MAELGTAVNGIWDTDESTGEVATERNGKYIERTGERNREAREGRGRRKGSESYLFIYLFLRPGVFMSAGRVIRRKLGVSVWGESCVRISSVLFVDQLVHFFTAFFAV